MIPIINLIPFLPRNTPNIDALPPIIPTPSHPCLKLRAPKELPNLSHVKQPAFDFHRPVPPIGKPFFDISELDFLLAEPALVPAADHEC